LYKGINVLKKPNFKFFMFIYIGIITQKIILKKKRVDEKIF